jgi:PKD repeat protein
MWVYEKDYSVSGGSDCAWLDYISLPSGASSALAASFTADQTDICEGTTINFTDGSTGNAIEWEWEFEGGSPATSIFQNPTVAYFESGTFDVTLTVSDGTTNSTVTFENYIEVDYTPETPETPVGEEEVCINFVWESEYTSTGAANADSYLWNLEPSEAGTISGNGTIGEVQWNTNYIGLAYVKVKGVNNCGDGAFSEALEVMVDICGGIDETNYDGIYLVPNPSNGQVSLQFTQNDLQNPSIEILDQLGRMVYYEKELELNLPGKVTLSLETLENGIYFVVIKGKSRTVMKKLLIR